MVSAITWIITIFLFLHTGLVYWRSNTCISIRAAFRFTKRYT